MRLCRDDGYAGQLEYDLGNLCAADPSPLDQDAYVPTGRPRTCLDVATAMTQALVAQLFALPGEAVQGGRLVSLPAPTTPLPREKPVPKPKPLTKWQRFAQERGIRKRKRSKLVYDEEAGEWRRRHGYKRANDDEDVPVIEARADDAVCTHAHPLACLRLHSACAGHMMRCVAHAPLAALCSHCSSCPGDATTDTSHQLTLPLPPPPPLPLPLQPGEDPFTQLRKEKRERVAKQAKQQAANVKQALQTGGRAAVPATLRLAATLPEKGRGKPIKRKELRDEVRIMGAPTSTHCGMQCCCNSAVVPVPCRCRGMQQTRCRSSRSET